MGFFLTTLRMDGDGVNAQTGDGWQGWMSEVPLCLSVVPFKHLTI